MNYKRQSYISPDQILFVYKTTNLINNKIYIGQHIQKKDCVKLYLGSGVMFKRAIKKHGKDNFKREILCFCTTLLELDQKESEFIKQYNSFDKSIGYNILSECFNPNEMRSVPTYAASHKEGIKNFINSDRGKERMKQHSNFMKEIHKTEEYKQKQISSLKKYNTEEVRKERGEKLKKFFATEKGIEFEKKRKEGLMKFHLDPERKAKRKEKLLAFFKTDAGKATINATIKKMTDLNKIKIKKYSLDGTFIREYSSIKEAALDNNVTPSALRNYKKTKSNIVAGFIWNT